MNSQKKTQIDAWKDHHDWPWPIAQSRILDLREIFVHSLEPLPWLLSTPEGTPRKTPKAIVAKQLQKLAAPADGLPENCNPTAVIDFHGPETQENDVTTFTDIATAIHDMACKEAMQGNRIDVVFDYIWRDVN